jgi:aryl-alcohol dehydrogenase-like predicted oxidoreductase
MRKANLGSLGPVGRLTLGGGGIGQVWGETSRDEALATLTMAVDGGVDVIDCAPIYKICEAFVGEAFGGRPPQHLKFTTKHYLATPEPGTGAQRLEASLEASLAAMRLPRVDVFFLHSNLHLDDYVYARSDARKAEFSTSWSAYVNEVIPAMEALKAQGRIGAWGVTGIGAPSAVLAALDQTPRPDVVQVIANLMDSPGALRRYAEPPHPRAIAARAQANGVGVMGIRAVQAGALTLAVDRELSPNSPDRTDYDRAQPYRALCAGWGEDPAAVAHRYALGMAGFDTIVLGVKNRAELRQCLDAEVAGPLDPAQVAAIDALGLANA